MVFCFCFEWRDGRGKAVLRLILSNLECSTLGETALCTAVTCRLCLCSDLGFSGSKGSKQDCHPQEAPTNLAAASLPQPRCPHHHFQGRGCSRHTGEWRCGLSKGVEEIHMQGGPGPLTHACNSGLLWWLRQETAAGLRPTQQTMFLKKAASSQSKSFPWLFSRSLAQHTLSQATLNKQTHTCDHRRDGVRFWMECSPGQLGDQELRSPQQAWWVNTSKATKTMSSWARKMQSVGSLGSQSKLVFSIRMGRAVIKSPTRTKLRIE